MNLKTYHLYMNTCTAVSALFQKCSGYGALKYAISQPKVEKKAYRSPRNSISTYSSRSTSGHSQFPIKAIDGYSNLSNTQWYLRVISSTVNKTHSGILYTRFQYRLREQKSAG